MGSITELPSGMSSPPDDPRPRIGGIPNAFVFAAGVVVGAALMIAAGEQPSPEPDPTPRSSESTGPSDRTPPPGPTASPSTDPRELSKPINLPIGQSLSVEIDGMLVSLAVPVEFESVYSAPHLLATGHPDGPDLVITTTDRVGSGCLRLSGAVGASAGSTASPAVPEEGPPRTVAARGPVAFTLDGFPGEYFHFRDPAEGCQPDVVWDGIVGDFGPRGAGFQLELWTLDVGGTTLVFGSYADNDAPAVHLEAILAVVASARISPISTQPASLTPAITEVGFIGLPPIGANPSAPVPATLVDEYPVAGGGRPFLGQVRIYDDGRMIWYRFFNGPAGENTRSTGYLQQRLSPVGVAMVQAHADLAEKDPMALTEWLPPSAWDDPEVRAYVPTRYGACLTAASPLLPGQFLMDHLPAAVADLLRAKPLVAVEAPESECRGLTTDEARALEGELRSAGFTQDEGWNRYVLQYELEEAVVTFEPIFPDGTVGCSGCG